MIEAVVDETRLSPIGGAKDFLKEFKAFAALLEYIRLHHTIAPRKHPDIWQAPVSAKLQLYSVLFEQGHLDDDVRALLRLELDHLTNLDDAIASGREFARGRLNLSIPCALLVVPSLTSKGSLGGEPVHLVGTHLSLLQFCRDAPNFGDFDEAAFMLNAKLAYPLLYFKDGLESQFAKFSKPYRTMRPTITQALTDLNDHLSSLLKVGISGAQLAARFRAVSAFSVSPESTKTHKNKTAMKERLVTFNDIEIDGVNLGTKTFVCEWHLKLEPHIDRIHYHSAHARIFVGIFRDHLTT